MTLKLVTAKEKRLRTLQYLLPAPWEDSVEEWLSWLRLSGMSKNSIKQRRGCVRVVARRSATNHPREVTLKILVEVCANAGWSNDYRKSVRQSLVSYFEWAIAQDLVTTNPAASMPKVSESPPNPKPAPDSVWFDLLDKAPPRVRLMALLAGEVGMRRAEVACVHADDLLEDVYGYSLIVHGKGGKQRVVPITLSLAEEFKAYVLKEGVVGKHIFPGGPRGINTGRPHVTPEYVGELVGSLMPIGWTMHKLRHRFATRGHGGTQDIMAVSKALGHASVATTQRYVAVSQQDMRRVSEAAYKPRSE